MKLARLSVSLLGVSLLLSPSFLAAADYIWNGAAGPGLATPGNWAGHEAPTTGGTFRCGKLYIANGDKTPFTYTEADGATAFICEDFKIGTTAQPGGSLVMRGGELVISSRWAPIVGHNNNRASDITISGGRLTIRSVPDAKESELYFRVGNSLRSANTRGVVNIHDGLLVIETPGNRTNGGLAIANDEASGEILVEGGMLVVSSIYGTSFQPTNGNGVGILTFGVGDGIFMQTDSKQLIFGNGKGAASSHINFLPGSRGQLSLSGATREDYESWVIAGRIRLSGEKTTPDRFKFTDIEGQGIYQLAVSR